MFCCLRPHLRISNPFKLRRRGLLASKRRRLFIIKKKRRSTKWRSLNLGSKTRRFLRDIFAACTSRPDTSSVTASDADWTIVSARNPNSTATNTIISSDNATNTFISDTATMIQVYPEAQPKWTGLRPILSAERIEELMPIDIPPRPASPSESVIPVVAGPYLTRTTTRPETPPAESRLSLPLEAYITPLSPPPRRRKRVVHNTEA